MNPTLELRFVERVEEVPVPSRTGGWKFIKTGRILQQKWMQTYTSTDESGNTFTAEEWRNVPVVKED